MIRNTSLGEVMVVLSLFQEDESARKALFDHVIGLLPDVTSWMYVINPKANDTIGDLDIQLYAGRDHIFEEMEGLKFKIGPKSFFQTNSEQALHLDQFAREFAGLSRKE